MIWKVSIVLFLFAACATFHVGRELDRVQPGMDKDSVLELAGNPQHTFHKDSQDHWIYEFYQDGQEMSRHIVFETGHVVKIMPSHLKKLKPADASAEASSPDKTPEEEMDQYEKDVREQQKKHESEFKDR